MSAHQPHPAQSFYDAAAGGLVALAIRLVRTKAARKRNLATLYEAGAITRAVFYAALKHYELEAS